MKLLFYAIVTHDGRLKKKKGGGYSIHTQYARACHWAKDEGDTVVACEVDLGKEPLFIQKKVL